MNRTSALLAVLLGASVIVNIVLILRPARPTEERSWGTRPSSSVPPGQAVLQDPPLVPPADREAELARLKRENDALKANNPGSPKTNEGGVTTLQEEQQRSVEYWQSLEAFSKAGRISDDPGAFHRVIQDVGDYLELNADQRAAFADAAQKGALMIGEARKVLDAIGNPLKQAGQSPPDDPQWVQANQQLHIQLRQAGAQIRKVLDRTKPRQNQFSTQIERWVNVVTSPWRG